MSFDEGIDKGDKPTFKWGKKRCMGGAKRSIPIYESFTYDEIEYFLYDCVYLYKDGEVEPYIGKLIKIWELPNGEKKIKVLWFFHPIEIRNYLRDNVALEKELFLASGEGVGLVNTNPLEAIAGKCNVVCISKDKRNPQPSEEEIKMADFIFFRTFDVGKLLISDVIKEKIAGQDVNFIFNKKRPEMSNIMKSEATAKDNNVKLVANNAAHLLSKLDLEGSNKDIGMDDEVVRESSSIAKNVDSKASLLNSGKRALDEPCSDDNNAQRKKFRVDDDRNSKDSLTQSDNREKLKPGDKNGKDSLAQSDDRAKLKHGHKNGKDSLAQSDDKGKVKPGDDLVKLDGRLFKKAKVNDNSSKYEVQCNISHSIVSDNDKASQAPISSSEDKSSAIPVFSSIREDRKISKRVKLDEKKTKLADESLEKLSAAAALDKEIKTNGQAMEVSRMPDVATNNKKASEVPMSCVEGKSKPIIASGSIGRDMGTSKKTKLDAKKTKPVDESLQKSSEAAPEKDVKTKAEEFNRRPDAVNNNDKDSKVPVSNTEGKLKSSTVSSLIGKDMGTSKKVKLDERKTVLAGESSQKTSEAAPDKDIKSQTMEVNRRPEADRSRWFKGLPWEERLEDAYKEGTLVLLENLDPSYTSSEIQDIIWHAFGVTSTAKVVQHTMVSSPHSGRALTIFKQKDAAETVVRRLEEGCLMLSDGRPLVGSRIPVEKGKQSQFFGHLVIDKVKFQMQRDEKKAVSTSHCSQPNTIEYEMAMDWKLLQSKSEIWWKDLYKQQGEELRKLGSGPKK